MRVWKREDGLPTQLNDLIRLIWVFNVIDLQLIKKKLIYKKIYITLL